jgi:hypothetical protein
MISGKTMEEINYYRERKVNVAEGFKLNLLSLLFSMEEVLHRF